MTNRDFVSEIRSMSKLLSSDNLLNDRSILREGKSSASLLIKRETDRRKLFQSPNLFTVIPCLEMTEVPLAECCDYTSEETISRSKEKLPKIGEGIFGLLIQQVSSVDGLKKFNESTPMRYANLRKLKLPTKNIYFWIYNNYLYVTNEDTKAVRMTAYFEDTVPNNILFPNCDCQTITSEDPCISDLDKDFNVPGYLVEAVKGMTYKKLLETYFNIPVDKTDDDKDEQSK